MIDERSIEKPTPINDKTIKANFGKKLSELRKAKELSRKELADIFSLSEITIRRRFFALDTATFSILGSSENSVISLSTVDMIISSFNYLVNTFFKNIAKFITS